jgi:hypothetical protein
VREGTCIGRRTPLTAELAPTRCQVDPGVNRKRTSSIRHGGLGRVGSTMETADASTVIDTFFERPILNSPYERPARHWELDTTGQTPDTNAKPSRLR